MSQDLNNKAIVIRDETTEGANTANRVGSWMVQASSEIDAAKTSADSAVSTSENALSVAQSKADKTNEDGNEVVYAPNGEIPIPDNIVSYEGDAESGTVDIGSTKVPIVQVANSVYTKGNSSAVDIYPDVKGNVINSKIIDINKVSSGNSAQAVLSPILLKANTHYAISLKSKPNEDVTTNLTLHPDANTGVATTVLFAPPIPNNANLVLYEFNTGNTHLYMSLMVKNGNRWDLTESLQILESPIGASTQVVIDNVTYNGNIVIGNDNTGSDPTILVAGETYHLNDFVTKDDQDTPTSEEYSIKLVKENETADSGNIIQMPEKIIFESALSGVTDRYYLKIPEKDFSFSFNYYYVDLTSQNTPSIWAQINLSNGVRFQIGIGSSGSYIRDLRIYRLSSGSSSGTIVVTDIVSSPVTIERAGNKLILKTGQSAFEEANAEIDSVEFTFNNNAAKKKTILLNILKNDITSIAELPQHGLGITLNQSLAKTGNYLLLSYYDQNSQATVSRLNLSNGKVEESVKLDTYVGTDAHNYLAIGIDGSGGVHVAGNAHNSAINYFYGTSYLNLATIARSTKLSDSSSTYPEFMLDDSGNFYYTIRVGSSGSSTNIVYKWDGTNWNRTTSQPIADGSNNRGGTAYFGEWVKLNNWFYNAWCWRRLGEDESTNNQVNLIKTQDFATFYGYKGEQLTLPITRTENPAYCIDNVPEGSNLLNQWGIKPFTFNNKLCVWYTKNDESGYPNLFIAYPDNNNNYTIKQVSQYKYVPSGATSGEISRLLSMLTASVRDCGLYLEVNLQHQVLGKETLILDTSFEVTEKRDFSLAAFDRDPSFNIDPLILNNVTVVSQKQSVSYITPILNPTKLIVI